MIAVMRNKFGPWIIGGIVGLIAFVFIFYGIFMPGSSQMGGAASVAGEVNGEVISYSEFSRSLSQRMEFYKSLMGGKVDEEMIKSMGIAQSVFNDIAQRKLLVQVAKKEGFYPSIEEVRDQILQMDAFKKDGRFDKVQYKNVLAQNQYTVARFEDLIAQDLIDQKFREFVGGLAVVSPDEVNYELKVAKEKRKIKYVYLDNEAVRKVLPKELKPEEQAKALNSKVEQLSQSLVANLNNDSKANAIAKEISAQVKTSDWLTLQNDFIPGVGSIKSIQSKIFSMKKADAAQSFTMLGGVLVAKVSDSESFDVSKVTAKDRTDTQNKLLYAKQSEIMASLLETWKKKATISQNDAVVVGGKGRNVPVTSDQ